MKNNGNLSEQPEIEKAPFSGSRLLSYVGITSRRNLIWVIIGAVVLLVFAALPFYIDVETSYFAYYLFMVFIYILMAQGWNLIAGYTGQISMGGNSFFGLGAYTTGIIWLRDVTHTWYFFDPLVMLLSGIVPIILAIIIGIPLLSRLRGDYFAFGTLGVGQILTVFAIKLRWFTGGADGLHLPAASYTSMMPYYWAGLALAVFAIAFVYFIMRSRWGLAFKAIREDETSAASHGVHVLRYKIIAFAGSAFLAGLAGNLYAYYAFLVNPAQNLSLNWIIYPILMVVLGGTGTIFGPVIGAFFVGALITYGTILLKDTHPILTGALIILVMIFMPNGLMGLKDKILARFGRT
jgi:branched-chain amino acid transport system permease protein